ncbi:MAG: LuxR C-terminal-related transcriptional regulator [Nocardioides sp.]|uniref:helix-turn-helix transcriptional regulator n=1 Tax=Nocardioides sp. TaxID=35761 RepID=UPI003F04D9B7
MNHAANRSWPVLPRPALTREVLDLLASTNVLLCGPPGIGKSGVAAYCAAKAEQTGAEVVRISGREGLPQDWAPPAGRPLLVVDDLDQLDASSAALLARAMTASASPRLLATARLVPACPPALARLLLEDRMVRVDVPALRTGEVRTLLESALSSRVVEETVVEIHRVSDGLPLHVRELVRGLDAAGRWHREPAGLLQADVSAPLPQLTDLVEISVAHLSDAEREALDLVALSGSLTVESAVLVCGEDAVATLVDHGLLREGRRSGQEAVVRIASSLHARVLRAQVPAVRRLDLHRRMTDHAGRGALPASRWVEWGLAVGEVIGADEIVDAARTAAADGEWTLAVRLADAVIERIPAGGRHGLALVDALILRAFERRFAGRPEQAADDLARGLEAWGRLRDEVATEAAADRLIHLTHHQADLLQYTFDQPEQAVAVCRATMADFDAEPGWAPYRGVVELDAAARSFWAGEPDAARALGTDLGLASGRAVPAHLSPHHLRLVAPLVLVRGFEGDLTAALDLVRRLEPQVVAASAHLPWTHAELRSAVFLARVHCGDATSGWWTEEEPVAATTDPAVVRAGEGRVAAMLGDWAFAAEALADARHALARIDPSGMRPWVLAVESFVRAMRGEVGTAAALLAEYDAGTPLISRGLAPDTQPWLARTLLATGRPDEAVERARRLQGWARERGYALVEAEALHLVGVAAPGRVTSDDLARSDELAIRCPNVLADLFATHLRAVARGDDPVRSATEQRLAGLGRWLPSPAASGGSAGSLSRREREVATLVAAGLPSSAIAERLALSTRTVESHLGRIYTKLGVRRRADVGAALQDSGVHGPVVRSD